MTNLTYINSKSAPPAIGPYSQAIVANGTIYCSGQIPLDSNGNLVGEGDVEKQTRQVLENLNFVLKEAGSSLLKVVKTTVLLKDINDFAKVNAVYGQTFGEHKPARICYQVVK